MFSQIKDILSNYKLLGSKFRRLVFFTIAENVTEFALPFILKQMYQIINVRGSTQELWKWLIVGIIVLILVEIFSRGFWVLHQQVRKILEIQLTDKYKKLISHVVISRINDIGTGVLISRFEQGISAATQIFTEVSQTIIIIGIKGVGVVAAFAYYQPKLLLPLIGFAGIYIVLELTIGKKTEQYTTQISKTNEQSSKLNVKYFSEFTMIKLVNGFEYEQHAYVQNTHKLPYRAGMQEFLSSMKYSILYLGLKGLELFTVAYLGVELITNGGDISTIILLSGLLMRARRPIEQATKSMSLIQKELAKYNALQSFVDQPSTIINGSLPYQYSKGTIQFSQVGFGYSDNPSDAIFDGLDLTISGGSKVALVGHSGSGKSTIIKLHLRLYDISSGQIMIDGQNIKELDIATLYDHIGYLTQEPSIFDGSIRENLEYGQQNMNQGQDSDLRQALEYAQLDNLIRGLPGGLDTQIGERGIKLSGGERQRLAIARIFLRNPDILILDEPTAALDSISEHKITEIIDTMMQHKTVIIIAHRLQTVMHADRIIVMDQGNIIQTGTHQELLAQPGLYQTLVNLQSGLIEE